MRTIICVIPVFAVGLFLSPTDPDDDLPSLQGTWIMVLREVDGERSSLEEVKTGKLVVKGDRYKSMLGDRPMSAILKVKQGCSPKAIDFTYEGGARKGETVKGIYKLEGNQWVICRALREEDKRPARFATGPGSGLIMVVWKRADTVDVISGSDR
jgi:uncharacterized protein (TIGR03067 family)